MTRPVLELVYNPPPPLPKEKTKQATLMSRVELTTLIPGLSPLILSPSDQLETALPVSQYHLQEWPMDGAPPTQARMLALVKHSRHHWMESGFGLIAVHTSCR